MTRKILDFQSLYSHEPISRRYIVVCTHTEDCDEPINRRDLKTRNTRKITSSKECNVEEDHLQVKG